MDKLIIEGGTELKGSLVSGGSKNASLPILAATLLTEGEVIIRRVPDVSDTNYMVQILRMLGAHVERSSGTVRIEAKKIIHEAPYDLVRKMRASVCVMGPLLARCGQARVSLPGGCVIGDRPIDLHLKGFEALGATVKVDKGDVLVEAKDGLRGAKINLRGKHGSTVLGTDNVLMAAVFAEGETIIEGAACEPEVADLIDFLNSLGAKISGKGTSRLVIEGVQSLQGGEHEVISDRIEVGTFLVAGALAGEVTVTRTCAAHQQVLLDLLKNSGHEVEVRPDNHEGEQITVKRGQFPTGGELVTETFPGFATDMQAQMCALFATSNGTSIVKETIFPQRFMHAAELGRMGANMKVEDHTCIITGVEQLTGAQVMASDLRASAALVLAGLTAKGTTEVNRLYHIDRGYEHIDEKLRTLGAKLRRKKD